MRLSKVKKTQKVQIHENHFYHSNQRLREAVAIRKGAEIPEEPVFSKEVRTASSNRKTSAFTTEWEQNIAHGVAPWDSGRASQSSHGVGTARSPRQRRGTATNAPVPRDFGSALRRRPERFRSLKTNFAAAGA